MTCPIRRLDQDDAPALTGDLVGRNEGFSI